MEQQKQTEHPREMLKYWLWVREESTRNLQEANQNIEELTNYIIKSEAWVQTEFGYGKASEET